MERNSDDIQTLGAKLDALELTTGERAVLDAVLSREDEAAGYSQIGFGIKIGQLFDTISDAPNLDGAGSYLRPPPIANGDLGSGRRDGPPS